MKALFLIAVVISMPVLSDNYKGQLSANPYATPRAIIQPGRTYNLYNDRGEYRGQVGGGKYGVDSIENPHGRYGFKAQSEANKYNRDSPLNKYGRGLEVHGQ